MKNYRFTVVAETLTKIEPKWLIFRDDKFAILYADRHEWAVRVQNRVLVDDRYARKANVPTGTVTNHRPLSQAEARRALERLTKQIDDLEAFERREANRTQNELQLLIDEHLLKKRLGT